MKKQIKDIFFDSKKGKIKLNQKASIFFFCLLLSTFFWFLSALSKNYNATLTIPIEYSKLSNEFILTQEPEKFLELKVSGSGFELLGEQMSLNRSAVEVDLNLARKIRSDCYGMSTDKLQSAILLSLDKDLELRTIITDSLHFKTQKKASKLVEIKAISEIEFEPGFNFRGKISVEPDSILISGPEGLIHSINFISTETIKQSALSDSIFLKIKLDESSLDEQLLLSLQEVQVLIPVEKFTEKSIQVPLEIRSEVKNIEIKTYPDEIKVIALVPLSKYEILDQDILSATVVFDKKSEEKRKLKVGLAGLPEYARLVRLEPDNVEFIIKK